MRVVWQTLALANLAGVADRAPRQAQAVYAAVERFSQLGFPKLGRQVPQRKQRYFPVPPQGVFYRINGDDLIIVRIGDSRRRKKPW